MPRLGRCRCGDILKFHRHAGYTTRCSQCSATVRLGAPSKRSVRRRVRAASVACACGAVVVLDKSKPTECPCCHEPLEAKAAPSTHHYHALNAWLKGWAVAVVGIVAIGGLAALAWWTQ